MREIELSKHGKKHKGKYVALVDDRDYEWLMQSNWAASVTARGAKLSLIYAVREDWTSEPHVKILMHRAIYERYNGPIPEGMQVDHKDHGDHGGLDNRLENLRLATSAQNHANSRPRLTNTSGYRGVSFDRKSGKWHARMSLGLYLSAEAAAAAYNVAAKNLYGDFAKLNPIAATLDRMEETDL